MSHIKKITEEYFWEVKRSLKWKWQMTRFTKRHINEVAYKHGISYKTVIQIKASRTYAEYVEQNKAQHPDTQYSLAEHVLELHKLVYDKNDNKYIPPKNARTAIAKLIFDEQAIGSVVAK